MAYLRKAVLWSVIPLNVALIAWVWMGRAIFGVEWGWTFIILMMTAVPLLVALLATTTVLAYRQPARPIRLTAGQAWAQLAVWAAMLAFGLAIVDFDDSDRTESLLSRWFGPGALGASEVVAGVSTGVAAVAWLTLLVLLIRGRRVAR